jgi:hypothetical protein
MQTREEKPVSPNRLGDINDPNFDRKLDLITEGAQDFQESPTNQNQPRELQSYHSLYPSHADRS